MFKRLFTIIILLIILGILSSCEKTINNSNIPDGVNDRGFFKYSLDSTYLVYIKPENVNPKIIEYYFNWTKCKALSIGENHNCDKMYKLKLFDNNGDSSKFK